MVKETGKFDWDWRVRSTYFAHFCSPNRGVGCLVALAGQRKPLPGFCHKLYEITTEPENRAPHLLHAGCIIHSHKHTVELVKYSRKWVHYENKELELQASLPHPEESQMRSQDERLLLNHKRHWDSWPLEEKNSIWGQRQGLITQSFCVIVLLKYNRDRESFWHRHQKGAERVHPH